LPKRREPVVRPEYREKVRETLNKRPKTGPWYWQKDPLNAAPEGLPQVPPAPMFRADPEVVGSPEFAQAVEMALKMAPELRGRVKRIAAAPTRAAINELGDASIPVHRMEKANLLGVFDPAKRDIYVNPLMAKVNPFDTLLHELAHVAGYGHGEETDLMEDIGGKIGPVK
jgi:hypothetical protein